jgi:hypothetical protein
MSRVGHTGNPDGGGLSIGEGGTPSGFCPRPHEERVRDLLPLTCGDSSVARSSRSDPCRIGDRPDGLREVAKPFSTSSRSVQQRRLRLGRAEARVDSSAIALNELDFGSPSPTSGSSPGRLTAGQAQCFELL